MDFGQKRHISQTQDIASRTAQGLFLSRDSIHSFRVNMLIAPANGPDFATPPITADPPLDIKNNAASHRYIAVDRDQKMHQ